MTIPIACLTCRFFELSPGERGYSELTPGTEATISCEQRGEPGCAWPDWSAYYSDVDTPALITRAANCKLYEPHPLLAAERSER